MLVGVPVHRVLDEVGADAAVVEQSVALTGGAVARDLLPGPLELDQEHEQCPLRLLHPLREARVPLGAAEAGRRLALEQRIDCRLARARAAGVLNVDAQGASMGPE